MATNIPNIYGSTGCATVNWGNLTAGAVGSSGYYTTASTWSTSTQAYSNSYNNDIIIRREGKEDIHIAKTLEMLMERLCIIEPAMDLIEKYPALKEAYENYKIVEAMVKHDWENDDGL
jgi:hypothetical protein